MYFQNYLEQQHIANIVKLFSPMKIQGEKVGSKREVEGDMASSQF